MVTMIVTYTDTLADGNIPKEWKTFLSGKQNDDVVFVKNLMNNEESKACITMNWNMNTNQCLNLANC